MPWSSCSIFVGALLGLFSAASFSVDLLVLIVLLRSKLAKSNPIYVLSAMNLFSDCLQNAGILLFLAPTSIAQDFLLDWARPNQPIWLFFMLLFQFQWYSSVFILIAISVNRLIAVVFPAKAHLINHGAVLWTGAVILPLSVLLTLVADFLLPCCRTNYSFPLYSYQFFTWKPANESAVNYKNILIDLPLNIVATAILFLCYGIIFLKVVQANRKEVVRQSKALNQNRRMGEVRYALQFSLISACFIAAWVSFRIFPAFVPKENPEWFSLTTFFEIGNCSANALIYLTMNQEVRQHFLSSVRSMLGLSSLPSISTLPDHQQASRSQQKAGPSLVAVVAIPNARGKGHKEGVEQWATRVNPDSRAVFVGCIRK